MGLGGGGGELHNWIRGGLYNGKGCSNLTLLYGRRQEVLAMLKLGAH